MGSSGAQNHHLLSSRPVVLLSQVSAIVCLVAVVVWIESYRRVSPSFSTATAPPVRWCWSSAQGQLVGIHFDPPVPVSALTTETPEHLVDGNGQANGISIGTALHGPGGDRLMGLYYFYGGVLFTGTTGSRLREIGIRY